MAAPDPYAPDHYPFSFPYITDMPDLTQRQINQLTYALIQLTNTADYLAVPSLPIVLSAYSAREVRINQGIWAFIHPVVTPIPSLERIQDDCLPSPTLTLPKQLVEDFKRPWVSVTQDTVRNAALNSESPRYRLVFFLHRAALSNAVPGRNKPNNVISFSVLDREYDTFRHYDFFPEEHAHRQTSIAVYWARVNIQLQQPDPNNPIVPHPDFYKRLRTGTNADNRHFRALGEIAAMSRQSSPARITIHAAMGAAMNMISQIDSPMVLVPTDSTDVLSGLRQNLVPRLFVSILMWLREEPHDPNAAPPVRVVFTRRLPRNAHAIDHNGQPFLDPNWVSQALCIDKSPRNELLMDRIRREMANFINAGILDEWYYWNICPL